MQAWGEYWQIWVERASHAGRRICLLRQPRPTAWRSRYLPRRISTEIGPKHKLTWLRYWRIRAILPRRRMHWRQAWRPHRATLLLLKMRNSFTVTDCSATSGRMSWPSSGSLDASPAAELNMAEADLTTGRFGDCEKQVASIDDAAFTAPATSTILIRDALKMTCQWGADHKATALLAAPVAVAETCDSSIPVNSRWLVIIPR